MHQNIALCRQHEIKFQPNYFCKCMLLISLWTIKQCMLQSCIEAYQLVKSQAPLWWHMPEFLNPFFCQLNSSLWQHPHNWTKYPFGLGVDRLSAWPILSILPIIDIGHFQNRFADNILFFVFFIMQTNILFTGDIIYWWLNNTGESI